MMWKSLVLLSSHQTPSKASAVVITPASSTSAPPTRRVGAAGAESVTDKPGDGWDCDMVTSPCGYERRCAGKIASLYRGVGVGDYGCSRPDPPHPSPL